MKDVMTYWNSDEFMSELISVTPAAIFWKNRDGVFLGCNKQFANLAGIESPGQIVGKTDYELPWGEKIASKYREDELALLQSGEPRINIAETITTSDGNLKHVLTSKTPLCSKDGEIVGILGVFHDITDSKYAFDPEIKHASALKILLVEDNVIALKIAENLLRQQNVYFQSAINGEQALALFKQESFDLVLIDIGLPDISGFDVTQQIRSMESEKQVLPIPIIGLTAHSIYGIESDGLAAGMNQVLSKPVSFVMLRTLIDDYLLNTHVQSGAERSGGSREKSPLLDLQAGINAMGSKNAMKEVLRLFMMESRKDMKAIHAAWKTKDIKTVQILAHKMKSSAIYCHAVRMRYACEMLEHFKQQGDKIPEKLYKDFYKDFCHITEQTMIAVECWLKHN